MAKQKKKRNKHYSGVDARVGAPTVTRVSAVERNRFQEWWLLYGRLTRVIGTVALVILVIILIIIGIVGIASR